MTIGISLICSSVIPTYPFSSRDNVKPLTVGVPNARYKAFPTQDEAKRAYFEARRDVKIVRNPGDSDEIYGPATQ